MHRLFVQLVRDDAGYIISGELVLVATIGVLSLVVGLSELSTAINGNIFDLGSAFVRLNQPCHAQTPDCGSSGCKSNDQSQSDSGAADVMGSTPPQSES